MARLVNLEIFKLSSNSVKVAGYSALKSLFIQNQVRFKRKVPIVDDFNYILVFLLVDRCVQYVVLGPRKSAMPLVRDFSENDKIFRREKKYVE